MNTVIGLFDQFDDAEQAVESLMKAGIDEEDIGLTARQDVIEDVAPDFVVEEVEADKIAARVGEGLLGGGAIGGVLGLLVGVGAIPIPGLGPAFAAGSIATAIGGAASGVGVGATAGALIGAMLGLSVEEEQAHAYAEGVKRGGVLVLAEVEAAKVNRVRAILDEAEAIDIEELRQTWEQEEGWTRFEADNQSSDHSA